jgi:hypothetical protein
MDTDELEKKLRDSPMIYSSKASYLVWGFFSTPCPDCPFKNENSSLSIFEKDKDCFERCPFDIMVWILNQKQKKLYFKYRPLKKKKKELEKAIQKEEII